MYPWLGITKSLNTFVGKRSSKMMVVACGISYSVHGRKKRKKLLMALVSTDIMYVLSLCSCHGSWTAEGITLNSSCHLWFDVPHHILSQHKKENVDEFRVSQPFCLWGPASQWWPVLCFCTESFFMSWDKSSLVTGGFLRRVSRWYMGRVHCSQRCTNTRSEHYWTTWDADVTNCRWWSACRK